MNSQEDMNIGSIVIRARSGYGLFPLSDVLVTIFSQDGENSTTVAVGYTDESGLSPEFVLPATVKEGSTQLKPIAQRFTIEASKPGYQTVILHGVQVYPGVQTVQNLNMAPLPSRPGQTLTEYDKELVQEEMMQEL
ncbi:MAG: carboxypeptidase regulatory-like domain-containing protein [Clostridia bacterium]|nr:carboxypeptidase regulatory-like domain-containing protein [Clostridia bacterium]